MHRTFIVAGLLPILAPHAALRAQGTPAVTVGWYNGDAKPAIPGVANWYASQQQFARAFDDFIVPAGGWTVAGVFAYNDIASAGVTEAAWEIRSGVSVGNGGTVVASGVSRATQTYVAAVGDGLDRYRVQVDGLRVPLPAGTYWLSVTPSIGRIQSYQCLTLGANATGNPPGNNGKAFFYSPVVANANFEPVQSTGQGGTNGDLSMGVLIAGAAPDAILPAVTAVVNAASFLGGTVAPGEVVTIGGLGLGPASPAGLAMEKNGGVSTTVGGVQVLFNDIAAPLIYVSGAQINAVVPYEIGGSGTVSVQVQYGGVRSNAFSLAAAPSMPALFTADGSGVGSAASLNQDNSYNGPASPAAKGSYIVLFLTGEGQTNPGGVTGKVTTVSGTGPMTPQPLLTPKVSIGGAAATVAFFGEAPGQVSGVMQMNVQIPVDTPSGNVAISVSIGGRSTQDRVTVSVR